MVMYVCYREIANHVSESDYNYDVASNGLSYAGDVSYTQEYKKCLEWDKVTHCNYHIFAE